MPEEHDSPARGGFLPGFRLVTEPPEDKRSCGSRQERAQEGGTHDHREAADRTLSCGLVDVFGVWRFLEVRHESPFCDEVCLLPRR
jgi:hypothetical protein